MRMVIINISQFVGGGGGGGTEIEIIGRTHFGQTSPYKCIRSMTQSSDLLQCTQTERNHAILHRFGYGLTFSFCRSVF